MAPRNKKGKNNNNKNNNKNNNTPEIAGVEDIASKFVAMKVSNRTAVGVLTSNAVSRDVKIEGFCLNFHGKELVQDSVLEINFGRRYGLIGSNGSGKSTLLESIAAREIPIPKHIDIFHLSEEITGSDKTAIGAVVFEVEQELKRLEAEEERVMTEEGPESETLQDIYDRIENLDPTTFESRAAELLFGLGFSKIMMNKQTKDLSGGWRMRVALARALFVKPTLLLLDEPTNHLDLGACVWLEEYLKSYDRTLIVISHSQDFLNGVTTNTIHLHQNKLVYYGGNYDTFTKIKKENEQNQMKAYVKQQDEIAHIKSFIASCGTYANLVKQAKSRQKILDKMEAAGLVQQVTTEYGFNFRFSECSPLAPPVLSFDDVTFSYSKKKEDELYRNINLAIDLDSRIALVGPNGAGKSTLLKLMCGDLDATGGRVSRHSHLKIGRYHQHSADQLDLAACPLDFFRSYFPNIQMETEEWRAAIGRYGITGNQQTAAIGTMSDGQKSRLIFALIAMANPHLLLMDEPTNHLDMDCIDALAVAINEFNGGLVLVSHDFRLISQVAKDIWVCEKRKVTSYKGTIKDYKNALIKSNAVPHLKK